MFGAPFSPKRAACGAQRRPRRCGRQICRFFFSRSPSSPCAADPSAASAAIVTDLRCRRGKIHDFSSKKCFDGFAGNFWYFGLFRRLLLFFVLRQRHALSVTFAAALSWRHALSVIAARCHCPGCGSQRLLRCRLHPAGRCPNSSSLFPPLAAVVAVAPIEGRLWHTAKLHLFARGSPTRGAGAKRLRGWTKESLTVSKGPLRTPHKTVRSR